MDESGQPQPGPSKSKVTSSKGRKRKAESNNGLCGEETNNTEQQQSSDTIHSCMTLDEKKRLLNVIKTRGFGIIYSPELLLDDFPGRSKNEISFFIETYKKKGKDFANKLKASANIDVNEKSGTEQWYYLVHNLVPHLTKRDDMADLLVDLFNDYSQECKRMTRPEGRANYDQIYGYIAQVLGGKYPQDLNAFDSLVVLSLLERLSDYCDKYDCQEEEELIKNSSWWDKPADDKSVEENREDNETPNNFTGSYIVRKYFESCLEYPKIRKIKQCLNPMNIPVKMLQDEHEKVSRLLNSIPPSELSSQQD